MKKIIALTIATLMLLLALASCANTGNGNVTSTTTKKPQQTTASTTLKPAESTTESTTESIPGSMTESTTESTSESLQPESPSLSLSEIVEKIYEKYPVELMMMSTTNINMTEATSSDKEVSDAFFNSVKYTTGLDEISGVKEIAYNGPMIGSQAYSLVLVRVDSPEQAEATARKMLDGINPGKWICVQADLVRACTKEDVIMLVLLDSELGYSDTEMANAFSSVMGGIDINIKK